MPLKRTRDYAVTDSPRLDRKVHRPLARPLTRVLLRTPITPNQVTVLSGAVGLAAALAFARGDAGWAVAGILLYLCAVVLDHADGEIARSKGLTSTFGRWLDIGIDCGVHGAVIVGLAIGSGHPDLVAWGAAGGMGVALAGLVVCLYPPRSEPAAAGDVDGALGALASRDFFYAVMALAAALRAGPRGPLAAFFGLVAVGGNLFWIVWLVLEARRPA